MDEDIYFIDTRNADSRDHRSPASGPVVAGRRPVTAVSVGGTGHRVYPAQQIPMYYPQGYPPGYPQPYMLPPGSTMSNIFGRVTAGQMVDMVAQIFAALMPLPSAPNTTSDMATDMQNLVTYNASLATAAKRDEQIRTLGNLVTKLVG
ncbi:MAG: hypothetical protein QM831_12540 [Kofleriaceae bacterium]